MTTRTESETGTALQPLLVEPRFDERIWGGHKLATEFGTGAPQDRPIGEAWEIYDENRVLNGPYAGSTIAELRRIMGRELTGHIPPDRQLPILAKLIDAHDVLSVQVHPDDHFARILEHEPNGKTECWYVIEAEPGATLTYGFTQDSSPAEYERLVGEGRLEAILRPLPVKPGDVIYIPAGTVHAIGAGIVVYELQQTSDITYRIYDWNRRNSQGHPRELHVDKAKRVLDYHRWTRGKIRPLTRPGSGRSMLVASEYFCMELVEAGSPEEISTYNSPVAVFALDRPVRIEASGVEVVLRPYSSLLVPAAAGSYAVRPEMRDGARRAVIAYVPDSQEAIRDDLRSRGFGDPEIDAFLAQFAATVS
ncbi:MAG TPA: type I phosphomannose isomerase catalytic subunit [Chloroflexota bacterium]